MTALTDAERASLLRLARDGLRRALCGGRIDRGEHDGGLAQRAAAFVTLTVGGALRGCTGALEPRAPLGQLVPRLAARSALSDPRFRPLPESDLDRTRIEISVLSSLAPIVWSAVIPGVHGLMVGRGARQGLLLPQVATEHRFSREQFLGAACRKAGLADETWRDGSVDIRAFTADVFADPVREISQA
jgi:AmmeMemoRadiSam system protein A